MKSKFLAILTLIFALCITAAYADEVNVDSGIKFVSQSGATIRSFPDVKSADYTMYASANVKNNMGLQKDLLLFAAVYDGNNNLTKVSYVPVSIPANDEATGKVAITIPKGTVSSNFICKAYLWDSVAGATAYRTDSVFLDMNTDLYGITVGGADVKEYNDSTDEYSVMVENENSEIKVYPKSGATNIQYSEINVPGISKIQLTNGTNRREISIKTYLDDKDQYTLSSLKYKIGNTEYEVEGFKPDIEEYTVNLPDNTFYVTLLPEAMGEVTCSLQDINDSPNVINGVSYGKMRTGLTDLSYVYERKMIDSIVPVKNEMTKAYINVTDGNNSTEYTINFRSVQPRLTSFEYVGADGDTYVPVFTSGAGLNNDNGTICASDRAWAAANISKKLMGASYFMSPFNNKGGGQWWDDHGEKGAEYFNFTADTAGTIYLMGSADPGSYSDWEKVNNGNAPTPPDGFTLGDKTWNDFDNTDYYMTCVKWNSDIGRCDECGVGVMDSSQGSYIDGAVPYKYAFAKHFEAGEKVVVPHTGIKGNGGAEIIWAVVWDLDVQYPGAEEEGGEEPGEGGEDDGEEEVIEEGLMLDLDAKNNTGEGILDEFTTVWKDLSKNGNDVTITSACEWGSDALWITNGTKDKTMAVLLSDNVNSVINTYNFTLEFEVENIDSGSTVAASKDEKFSLYEDKGKLVCFFAGKDMVDASLTEVISGYNQITVSYDSSSKKVTMKWYIDGVLKSDKTLAVTGIKTVDAMMLGSYNRLYSGTSAIKKFRVFDYTKTAEDINK